MHESLALPWCKRRRGPVNRPRRLVERPSRIWVRRTVLGLMTRGRALIRQFAQEQPIISHGNERRLGLGVLHPRGKPKTFSRILSVFPGSHFSTSHTNGASACQCLQATINNPHSNKDACEPSAVLIEHPLHPLQLYRKSIQTQATGHREPFAILLRWRPPPVRRSARHPLDRPARPYRDLAQSVLCCRFGDND
jgi:hypothetical protein